MKKYVNLAAFSSILTDFDPERHPILAENWFGLRAPDVLDA